MQCPKDKSAMRSIPIKDFTFDACDTCGGVWFDEEELKKTAQAFAEDVSPQTEEYSQILKENDVPPVLSAQKKEWPFEKGVSCPLDGTTTQKLVYSGDSGIIFEKCGSCGGMWFDGDELVRLAEYVKPNSRDMLGKLMIQQMNQFNKENQELAQLPVKIGSAFSSPAGFVVFFAQVARDLIVRMAKSS